MWLERVCPNRGYGQRIFSASARVTNWLLGVRVEVIGLDKLDPEQAYVFTPDHRSHVDITAELLRKGSRIGGRLNSDWYCVYVQTPEERSDRIDAAVQRHLVDNIQKAQSMGAEVVKLEGTDVPETICRFATEHGVTLIVAGQSRRTWWQHLTNGSVIDRLVNNRAGIDVLVVSPSGRSDRISGRMR